MNGAFNDNALYMASRQNFSSPELAPEKVRIDDRSTTALFAMLHKLSDQFWYYDQQGEKSGDWSAFFESDLTALVAIISEEDKTEESNRIMSLLDGTEGFGMEECWQMLKQCLELLIGTVVCLNARFEQITVHYYKHSFQVFLYDLIAGKLSFALKAIWKFYAVKLGTEDTSFAWVKEAYKKLQKLPVIWSIGTLTPKSHFANTLITEEDAVYLDNDKCFVSHTLKNAFTAFYDAYTLLTDRAKSSFEIIKSEGNTQPHIALLLTFLKLFKHQQAHSNGLVSRYLNFYYKEVLKFEPKPARADETFILFTLNDGVKNLKLTKGVPLAAGETEGGDSISFVTEQDVLLSSASISKVQVVGKIGNELRTGVVSDFEKPQVNPVTGEFNTFSVTVPKNLIPKEVVPSKVGFAISNPCLFMQGGERCIKITLNFIGKTEIDIYKLQFSLTTASGWLAVKPVKIDTACHSEVCFRIKLAVDEPSVTNYNEDVHGPGFHTAWPILKCLITEDRSILRSPEIVKIGFKGYAKKFRDLQLFTSSGEITPEADPVALFGMAPEKGSEFIIGSYEPFIKPLTTVDFEMDWFDLLSQKAFTNYYKEYLEYLKQNLPFKITISKVNATAEKIIDLLEKKSRGAEESKHEKEVVDHHIAKARHELENAFKAANGCVSTKKGKCLRIFQCEAQKIINALCKSLAQPCETLNSFYETGSAGPSENPCWADLKSYALDIAMLQAGTWKAFSDKQCALFPQSGTKSHYKISLSRDGSAFQPDLRLSNPPELDAKALAGFLKLQLISPDDPFANHVYPQVLNWVLMKNAEKLVKLAKKRCLPVHLAIKDLPNSPFVPRIKSASMEYHFCQKPAHLSTDIQAYWIKKMGDELTISKMPSDENGDKGESLDHLSEEVVPGLYLGFDQFPLESTVNLFFGIVASPDNGKCVVKDQHQDKNWYIQTSAGWKPIDVISDTTMKWQQAGIIKLLLPRDLAKTIKRKDDLIWIKAELPSDQQVRMTMLGTNAVKVRRNLTEDSAVVQSLLKPEAISELLVDIPEIKEVYQPFGSRGLTPKESLKSLRQRAAYRLNYKDRSQSVLACQRLILENFKEVYQVNLWLHEGRKIEVFVVESVHTTTDPNRYAPLASPVLLAAIRDFLKARVSAVLDIEVKRPTFQLIEVETSVSFYQDFQNQELVEELNADLKNYLSPWIEQEEVTRDFRYLDLDQLTNFIRQRPFVSCVQDVKVDLKPLPVLESNPVLKQFTQGRVWPARLDAVLNSASLHTIYVNPELVC